MKIKKMALWASACFVTGATALLAKSQQPLNSFLEKVDWMYLSIAAICMVLIVLIVLIFWTRRRGSKKS